MVGENGIKLSGGQRQRLAIARSIIKRPPILILDEATSSIDVRGERIVQEALDRVSKHRTTITIAHRLSTIKKADNIIVMKDGKAIEQGTHESLLSARGTYYNLINSQHLAMNDGSTGPVMEGFLVEQEQTARQSRIMELDGSNTRNQRDEPKYKVRGLVNSVGLFLWEQRHRWILYVWILIGAAAGGGMHPAVHVFSTYWFASPSYGSR